MLNRWQITLLFLGDLLPLFTIGLLFYIQPFYIIQFIFFLGLLVISAIGAYYWKVTLKKAKDYNRDTRKDKTVIKKVEDRGSIYTVYIVTYISVLPLMSKSLAGLISFAVILLIVFSLYMNSDMLFYNPILALFGFRFYRIEIGENSDSESGTNEIYAISKSRIRVDKAGSESKYKFLTITDFTYFLIPINE
jgi:hypothetical protein